MRFVYTEKKQTDYEIRCNIAKQDKMKFEKWHECAQMLLKIIPAFRWILVI